MRQAVHPAGIGRGSGKADPLPGSDPPRPSAETPVMHKKASFCTGRARGLLHPSVLQSGKVSVPRVGDQRHPRATDHVFHVPFPSEKNPNHPGSPARRAARWPRSGCETPRERSGSQPDPRELHVPPILIAPTSPSLPRSCCSSSVRHPCPPLTAWRQPSVRSETPLLAVSPAPRPPMPTSEPTLFAGRCARACRRGVSAEERRAERRKTVFSGHRYLRLPAASVQREKSAYEGGICSCPSVNTQDLSQRLSWEKTRTLERFPPPRHSPFPQTLFSTWLTCQQGKTPCPNHSKAPLRRVLYT